MPARVSVCRALCAALFVFTSIYTAECVAQVHTRQGAVVDPYGKPLPSREQQRLQLERLLGRQINDSTPIQRGPVGAAAQPYSGADNPVAYTVTDSVSQPTSGDLAETPDVKFTPEVQSVIARLGADPQSLYLYVKNGYVYTPYLGSQKGSQGTELEFAGNDYDQASFLIALLRAAGIPARYVFGSMYIPTAQALNWLQVDSTAAATNILQWQGIPAQFVNQGGGSMLINRVWVEAFVGRHGPNPRWVPMDPAFKQYQITPASSLATSISFDQTAYLNLSPTDPRTPYEYLSDNLQSYLNTAAPGTTVDQVVRSSSIIPTVLSKVLPGKLENRVQNRSEASSLTDFQRYQVTIYTVDSEGVSAEMSLSVPQIYGQRLTVSFPPATASDQALVQSSGGYYNAPADQLNVVASINLNGQAIATGSRAVSIGAEHYVVVDLQFPGAAQPVTVYHTVFAGGYYGLGLDVQGDSAIELSLRKEAYTEALLTAPDPTYNDATTGDFMNTAALAYLNNVQSERLKVGALFSSNQVMDVSEALTEENITIEYVNGIWHFRPIDWVVDAQRLAGRLYADNGEDSDFSELNTIDGLGSSFQESRLWDLRTGLQSISTTRGLQFANTQGIPIYQIDQTNAATLLPTLNVFPDVLQNVQDEVNAGYIITIPADTLVINQWEGSVWIEQTPDGSSTAYLIEGGLFGGSTTQDPQNRQNTNPSCSDVSNAFDADSGPFNSDFDRAVAQRESGWLQFDPSGDPVTNENSNGSVDIGLMQINDNVWAGNVVYLPGGTPVTVNISQVQSNWQYNIEVGAAILNMNLQRAQTILQNLGDANPSDDDLLLQAYYIYNHGSNTPPIFTNANGTGLQINPNANQQGLSDALAVQNIFDNQSWPSCSQ